MEKMTSEFVKAYTVKEVSKMIGVPPGTLRQWEKDLDGLLIIPRTKQGARFYTDEEINMLNIVKQMRAKSVSKEMIKELFQKHLDSKGSSEAIETVPAMIDEIEPAQEKSEMKELELYAVMEEFRTRLIDDVRAEIRTSIKKEVLEEVKKEISKGSLHTVKSLSDSIYKSNEKTKEEIQELSKSIHKTSEETSETLGNLSRRIVKTSKGTSEQIRNLTKHVADSSEAASEEFKTMIHYISSSAEVTHTEISSLIETLNTDREIYLETINQEREQYWQDVHQREKTFQDLIVNFRSAAAAEEEKAKPWWKFWESKA